MAIVNVLIGPYEFNLIDGDEITENIIDSEIEVIVPVYGNPYLRYNNPVSKGYTENTISLEGPEQSFTDLAAKINNNDFSITPISIGSRNFFNCIVVGISSQKNVTQSKNRIRGQIKVIKI